MTEKTINDWKHKHKDFMLALKTGKLLADMEVSEALFKKATGYQHEDVDIKMYEGQIIKTPLVKHYPPDTTAGIFWLKNRQPKQWRDKQDIDHTTKGEAVNVISLGAGIDPKPDFSKLSVEEKRTLIELNRKIKSNQNNK